MRLMLCLDGSMRLDRVVGKVCSYSPYKVRKRIPYEDMIYKHLVTRKNKEY